MGPSSDEKENEADELLPGLPDTLTIEHISTLVPWGKLHAISKNWRRAIRNGEVYEARVRAHANRTVVAMIHCGVGPTLRYLNDDRRSTCRLDDFAHRDQCLSLFNPVAGSWHGLPPVPGVYVGVPYGCELLYLKRSGTLYLLGGDDDSVTRAPRRQVHALNLWNQPYVWKQCGDMSTPRQKFSSGVMNGKLYVFGGQNLKSSIRPRGWCTAESYDPEKDLWTPIAPMLHEEANENPVIDEVLTLDGFFLVRGHLKGVSEVDQNEELVAERRFVEIYNVYKDQWGKLERDINTFGPGTHVMTVDGNFFFFEKNHVIMYDFRKRSPSSQVNTLQIANEMKRLDDGHVCTAAPAGNGEVLVLHRWEDYEDIDFDWRLPAVLLKSRGLGNTSCGLEWEKVPCDYEFDTMNTRMCVVEV